MTGLVKQVISYNFESGIDTYTAPSLVVENNLINLQNGRFIRGTGGSIQKRNGYNQLSLTTSNNFTLQSLNTITTFQNELDIINYDTMYSYSPADSAWINKTGSIPPIQNTYISIAKNANSALNSDSCTTNNISGNPIGCYAWEDSRGGVWCKVIDRTTGTILLLETQLGSTLKCPTVKLVNGLFQIFCLNQNTSGIIAYLVDPNHPTNNPTSTGVTIPGWDNTFFEVVYYSWTNTTTVYNQVTIAGAINGFLNIRNYSAVGFNLINSLSTANPVTGLAACQNGPFTTLNISGVLQLDYYFCVTYWSTEIPGQANVDFYSDANLTLVNSYTNTFGTNLTPFLADIVPVGSSPSTVRCVYQVPVLANSVSTVVNNISGNPFIMPPINVLPQPSIYINYGVGIPTTGGTIYIQSTNGPQTITFTGISSKYGSDCWVLTGCTGGTGTMTTGGAVNYYTTTSNTIYQCNVTVGTGIISNGVYLRGIGLSSKQFNYNSHIYTLITFPSQTQATQFLADELGNIVGKFNTLNAGPLSTNQKLPGINSLSSGMFSLSIQMLIASNLVASPQSTQPAITTQAVQVVGVEELQLDFSTVYISTAPLGQNLHIANGSILKAYDGVQVTELGFNNYPEPLIVNQLQSQIAVTTLVTQQPTSTVQTGTTDMSMNGLALNTQTVINVDSSNVTFNDSGSFTIVTTTGTWTVTYTSTTCDGITTSFNGCSTGGTGNMVTGNIITGTGLNTPITQVWLTFPKNYNLTSSNTILADGTLIKPGEYFMIGGSFNGSNSAATTGTVVYFVVDGIGSAPSLGGVWTNYIPVKISSQNTCQEIAWLFYQAVSTNTIFTNLFYYNIYGPNSTNTQYGISVGSNKVLFTQIAGRANSTEPIYGAWSQPVMDRQFGIVQSYPGFYQGGRAFGPITTVSLPYGSLIQPGNYFTFQTAGPDFTNSPLLGYIIYYVVNGVGTQPTISTQTTAVQTIYIQVNINSTDSNTVVATKTNTALNTNFNLVLTIVQNGPQLDIQGATESASMNDSTMQSWLPCTPGTMCGAASIVNSVAENGYLGVIPSYPYTTSPSNGLNLGDFNFYQYNAVYEWVDGQGQLHQSAPCLNTTIAVPQYGPVGSTFFVPLNFPITNVPSVVNAPIFIGLLGCTSIQVPTLRLSDKSNVDIAIYRTTAQVSDTPPININFFRASSPVNLFFNNSSLDYLIWGGTDGGPNDVVGGDYTPDSTLSGLEVEYTDGGVVENDGPPAIGYITSFQDRLWATQLEDPYLIWYSKEFSNGLGVAFSATQTIRIDPSGGPITSIIGSDNKLIILCQSMIWALNGPGPDAAGKNGEFNGPDNIAANTGCRDTYSTILFNNGIIFKSWRGFWQLDRSDQLSFIGQPVSGYNPDSIVTSAISIPTTNEIRFLSNDGTTLLYDWQAEAWGTFTNHIGSSATTFNNTYYYVSPNTIYQESSLYYADGLTPVAMSVTTPWYKFGAISSYKRLYEVIFKGTFNGLNPLQIQTFINYDNTAPVETFVYNPNAGNSSIWGGDQYWGQSTPWGGTQVTGITTFQFRYKIKNQKASSYQFVITELPNIPTTTASYSLDGIDFVVGIKKGGIKLSGAQTIG